MRQQIFGLNSIPLAMLFHSDPLDTAEHQIISDIEKIYLYSKQLTNQLHVFTLIEKAIGFYLLWLPEIKNGKQLYQLRVKIRNNNPGDVESLWYNQFGFFQECCYGTIRWIHFSRALHGVIEHPEDMVEICKTFSVSQSEIQQFYDWYLTRGKTNYGEKRPAPLWAQLECNEEDRFKELYTEFRNHASKKLASSKFSYLTNLYEERPVLIHQLLQRAWIAVVITAHKPIIDSLRLGKSYMNTFIHHLAASYTTKGKQLLNPATGLYENQELQLLNDPNMDESKHLCLAQEDEGYAEVEMAHTLAQHLNAKELTLVQVLAGYVEHKSFEKFAETKPDRRLAAFEFFGVSPEDLRECLMPLFHLEAVAH
jgi:hypothetical protein